MTDTAPPPFSSTDTDCPAKIDPVRTVVGAGCGTVFLGDKYLDVVMQLPLPGIVIFVHGVNSDGEWFAQAEEGLCRGLNDRLRRRDDQLAHPTVAGGQLRPVQYVPDLTPDGYLNPEKTEATFIESDQHFSPVIHFRWGYKASAEDLQTYGDKVFLNERNYWGGGPFANGCTALPDLWGEGLSDELFLWFHVQHLNPTNDRTVYACPPRPYYVLAALRLARLIEAIRQKQADVPVTIVCHSQGNMVAMAAAFLGDRLVPATDPAGKTGRCVADTYVLCNPPYSLVENNGVESWSERHMRDPHGNCGRQVHAARVGTLRAFFDIIRAQAACEQAPDVVDEAMENEAHGFDAVSDRKRHGYGAKPSTHGRVTLYFNPHDQVISSSTVQGFGWRGLSAREIADVNGAGVFCQRVFAQAYTVGKRGTYDFWKNHHGKGVKPGSQAFWHPESPRVRYSIGKGLRANERVLAKILTLITSVPLTLTTSAVDTRINALPPDDWSTPLAGPDLPEPFVPESLRFGQSSRDFDEGMDAPGDARDRARVRDTGDPYLGDRPVPDDVRRAGKTADTDAARGDADSEAALRYEHHAMLRMEAKRDGRYAKDKPVTEEDELDGASAGYKTWRTEKIRESLAANIDTHATDHSTIMTNPMHAQKALAYDVAVGVCRIDKKDLAMLRQAADWRFPKMLPSPFLKFGEYFKSGKLDKKSISEWANGHAGEGSMPAKIIDQRKLF